MNNKTIYNQEFLLIAGPCVIENYETVREIALFLKNLTDRLCIPFIFKASYDKANRTSVNSYRGPGIKDGLAILGQIKKELNIKIISDVHSVNEVFLASEVLDFLQIPALLCRQTDILLESAKTNKPINIKKGQFLAPWDVINIIEKIKSVRENIDNSEIFITERGTSFGYNNLIVDFRGIKIMQDATSCPIIFDATHSVQIPGGNKTSSSGHREFAPILAKAAIAAGADGIFLETYIDPDKALCDGPNSLRLSELERLLICLKELRKVIKFNY